MIALSRRRLILWMTAIAAVLINIGWLLAAYTRQDMSGCVKDRSPCDPALVQPYILVGSVLVLIGVVLALIVIAYGLRAAWRHIRSRQRRDSSASA